MRHTSTCHPEPTTESDTQQSTQDPTPKHIQTGYRTSSRSPCWSQQTDTTHDHPHEAPPSEQHPTRRIKPSSSFPPPFPHITASLPSPHATDNALVCVTVTVPEDEVSEAVRAGAVPPAGVGA